MQKIDLLAHALQNYRGAPIRLMEVCGTHTHQLSKLGIPALLSPDITLISGPGCPVCVTPAGYIDRAAALSRLPASTLLSFGDMLRVPGRNGSLLDAKAAGGSIQLIYSPLDALTYAQKEPGRTFYLAAVGFETTLPLYALLLQRMQEQSLSNIRLLTAVKALLPGLAWLCGQSPSIDGFIGPGHVSAILGSDSFKPFCQKYQMPMSIAGFSYEHLIAALYDLMEQKQLGSYEVHNLYPGVVTREGNPAALHLIQRYFTPVPSLWRGLGRIEGSGYGLAAEFAAFDAGRYDESDLQDGQCLCGSILTGKAQPVDCPCFGTACTPLHPLGPCMVSSEGACGIWQATARTR